ncbi:hypothetical protein L3Y34_019450 [Caenorhabditis briggsae]|uniref:Uncharacterized protein n=1 Tax=Caenorhabditis briggsae TaxID=6238 RepID=A0AAE9DPW0_CAEBR|nr:hypothetical protein L3Y34_019450 [Caenorhabditis briggsae]
MVFTPPVKKVKMSEKSTKHKEEEESSVPKNGEDVVEQGERGDRPSGIVEPFFDPRQFTGLYGTDEDLERILRETAPFQTTSSDSEFSTPPIRQAPSRAETTSSESSDSDSESSSPQLQEEKPEGGGYLKKAPELKKDLHLEKKPVEEGKGLQSFEKVLELEKNRQLEKFENSGGGWERSDSFEAVYGDGEEYQVDTRGEVSEGSIYVPTPKASPADGNYCLFGGEYMSKAEQMLLEKAMEESLKEQKDKEAEAVPVKDRLRFQQPATSSDRAVSVAKKTSPPPPFKEQFENVSWDVSEWYKGEIEHRPTEFWIPDSDVPSTSNFTDADAKRATDRIMMEFYDECRWAMRRKQRKMLE